MAAIQASDVFDFPEYSGILQSLQGDTDAFAKATESAVSRIHAAFHQVITDLKGVSAGLQLGTATGGLQAAGQQIATLSQQATQYRASLSALNSVQSASQQLVTDLTSKLQTLQTQYNALDPAAKGYAKQQRAILLETRNVTSAIAAQGRTFSATAAATTAAERAIESEARRAASAIAAQSRALKTATTAAIAAEGSYDRLIETPLPKGKGILGLPPRRARISSELTRHFLPPYS